MTTTKSLTDPQLDILKSIYISGKYSINELSKKSETLIGQHVTTTNLKGIITKEGWRTDKIKQDSDKAEASDTSINTMVEDVMNIVYESILKEWKVDKELNPAKVNAFMNLLDKANINIAPQGSAKTGLQQALSFLQTEFKK